MKTNINFIFEQSLELNDQQFIEKAMVVDQNLTQKAFEKTQEMKKMQKANHSSGLKNTQSLQMSKKVSVTNIFWLSDIYIIQFEIQSSSSKQKPYATGTSHLSQSPIKHEENFS